MRFLGTSLIVLAVAFSAGGVAYRTQAGSQLATDESSTSVSNDAGPAHDSKQCELAEEVAPEPFVLDLGKLPGEANDTVRPLNRTGYNYRQPGLWYPPQPEAPSVPAAPKED